MGRFQDFSVVRGAPVVGKGYWQARIIVFEKGGGGKENQIQNETVSIINIIMRVGFRSNVLIYKFNQKIFSVLKTVEELFPPPNPLQLMLHV